MIASVLQETLFILQNAGLFRTQAGNVYQVTSCCSRLFLDTRRMLIGCCKLASSDSLIAGYRYRCTDLAKRDHLPSRWSIRCTIQN